MHYFLKLLFVLFVASCALLTGCGSTVPIVKPFKMDIQQGNVVTSKMLLQLRPGMSKSQVKFVMGTPLIVDSFHGNHWDYFYQLRQAGKIVEQRRVILDFEKELLIKVRGDVVPQGAAGADTGESNGVSAPITVEPKPKETSMLDKLKFWKKDEKAIAKPVVVTPAVTATAKIAAVALPVVVTLAETKEELKKPEIANTSAEKIVSEASIVELPAAESLAASDAPSVLAMPIDLPSIEQSSAESAVEEVRKIETLKDGAVTTEPLRTKQYEEKAAPSITGKDSLKPSKLSSEKLLPAKPDYKKTTPERLTLPSAVLNKAQAPKAILPDTQLSRPLRPLPDTDNKDEKLIFRLDRSFDISRADKMKVESLPANALPVDSMPKLDNQSKPQKVDLKPLPPESEPSFFDKMLEKVGF